MNTSIAPDSSNDSTDMSPALTQDNSQDVASDEVSKSAHLLAKLKSVNPSDPLAQTILRKSDELILASAQAENVDLSKFGTTYASRKSRGLKPERSEVVTPENERNGSTTHSNGDGIQSTDNRTIMTPGISLTGGDYDKEEGPPILPYLIESTSVSQPHAETNGDEANQGSNSPPTPQNTDDYVLLDCDTNYENGPSPISVHETGEPKPDSSEMVSLTPDASPKPKIDIPVLSDLQQQHHDMADQTSAIIKRIRHLQSLVATRHTRQQLMTFVEHQHKLTVENASVPGPSNTHSVISLTNATNQDLNSMSTAALVELVQKMHGSNNNHRGERKTSEKRKRKRTMTFRDKECVEEATGVLSASIRRLHEGLDSDATASSSGGETDDEDLERFSRSVGRADPADTDEIDSENLRRSACWRWSRDRSRVISRWTWLQAQVSDLEFRIRQHGEVHRQLRISKTPLITTPAPVTSAQANNQTEDLTLRAARCIPLPKLTTTRHKIIRVSHAPSLGQKARRPVMVRCQCMQTVRQCAICAGHHHYAQPMDIQNLPRRDRIGQIDQGFHPVLSFSRDVNTAIELEEVVNSTEKSHASVASTDKKMVRLNKKLLAEARKKQKLAIKLKKAKEKKERKELNRKRKLAMAEQIANKKQRNNKNKARPQGRRERADSEPWEPDDEDEQLEEEYEQSSLAQSAPASSDLTKTGLSTASTNKRASQYDIDDIVIPYHIAAATRVEKLQYKEIDTPRWREFPLNGVKTVHDKLRRRSSSVSMSVPATPVTPAGEVTPMTPADEVTQVTPARVITPTTPALDVTPTKLSGESTSVTQAEESTPVVPTPEAPTLSAAAVLMEPLAVQTNDVTTAQSQAPAVLSKPSELNIFPTPLTPQSNDETTLSARSSATSLALRTLEAEEDISDSKYIALHDDLEVKEKSRYMNFVTVNRSRQRTQSTAATSQTNTSATNHHKTNSTEKVTLINPMVSPAIPKQPTVPSSETPHAMDTSKPNSVTTPLMSPAVPNELSVLPDTSNISAPPLLTTASATKIPDSSDKQSRTEGGHQPLTLTNSIPSLSASHDGSQLREELASTTRKRSCSFTTNRLKKDQSLDSAADKPLIQPWIARTFPLSGDDEASLDFNWKPPLRPRGDTATVSGNSDQRWKVISAEEEDRRNALVLKLSKTHQ